MFKRILSWLADLADACGEFLENLSKYPGLGFLAPLGDLIGGFADKYASTEQKIEWQKHQLAASKNKASEVTDLFGGGQGQPEQPSDQGPSAAAEAAADARGTSAQSVVAEARRHPSQPPASGTVMLEGRLQDTAAEARPEPRGRGSEPAAGRRGGPPARTAYTGTLAGPEPSVPAEPTRVPGRETIGKEDWELAARRERYSSDTERGQATVTAAPPDYLSAGPTARAEPRGRVAVPQEPAAVPQPAPTDDVSTELAEPRGPVAAPWAPGAVPRPVPPPREEETPAAWPAELAGQPRLEEDQPALIPLAEREQELARLEYCVYRLRHAREPLCGVNGVLVLVPLATIRAGPREDAEIPRAIQADLTTVQDQLGLRFPSTALLVGLEEDQGFEELVRRIGPQRAASQRFGHRFDVRSVPVAGQLSVLCARITGVFEDWVYAIFRERGSLARPGNSHLFGLLCKVRTELQSRLLRMLAGGFGADPQGPQTEEPIAFSGCYFAATGRTEDRRAFVRGVFDKLMEEQDQVEWTRHSLSADRRYRRFGWLGLLAAAAGGAWLVIEWMGG